MTKAVNLRNLRSPFNLQADRSTNSTVSQNRQLRTLFTSLLSLILASCSEPKTKIYLLSYEIRTPKTYRFPNHAEISLVTENSIVSCPLNMVKLEQRNKNLTYIGSNPIFGGDSKRGIVLDKTIFNLKIPSDPKVTDWTDWQSPDAVGDSWDYMHGDIEAALNSSQPFHLRYRIENWQSPSR